MWTTPLQNRLGMIFIWEKIQSPSLVRIKAWGISFILYVSDAGNIEFDLIAGRATQSHHRWTCLCSEAGSRARVQGISGASPEKCQGSCRWTSKAGVWDCLWRYTPIPARIHDDDFHCCSLKAKVILFLPAAFASLCMKKTAFRLECLRADFPFVACPTSSL